MNFTDILNYPVVLTEGGMVERINRNPSIELDPHIAHAGLIYNEKGRETLRQIYTSYIDVGKKYDCPFLSLTPTWRANPERIKQSEFHEKFETINKDCVNFLNDIRQDYKGYSEKIFIGGMMACYGDAYVPEEALSEKDAEIFHSEQAGYLAKSNVDFIKAATLPALSEAMGIAKAIAKFNIPYILSFVIKPNGCLLDGTPLYEAIETIDSNVNQAPFFYMINCVHPLILSKAMDQNKEHLNILRKRVLGFQANTSAKSPKELNNLEYIDTTNAEDFAELLCNVHTDFGIKILGGCCGSDDSHINAIGRKVFDCKTS